MPRMIINANDNVVELTHSMMIGRKEQSSEERDDDANVVELTHSIKYKTQNTSKPQSFPNLKLSPRFPRCRV